jgi:hypothetical protein
MLEENVHLSLLEGWECDIRLNLISFIALWPNFHEFFFFSMNWAKKVHYLGT